LNGKSPIHELKEVVESEKKDEERHGLLLK
jgi:hypothetical protein